MNHIKARQIVIRAFEAVLGRAGTRSELALAQAWGDVESSYGEGWRGAGEGSNNWGAIQAGTGWKGATFLTKDTSPQSDGTTRVYEANYRSYPTPVAGCEDLMRILFLGRHAPCLEFASKGDVKGFCASLQRTVYYEGRGATVADRVFHRRWQVTSSLVRAALELGEPLPNGSPPPATFRDGEDGQWAKHGLALIRALGHGSVRVFQERSHPVLRRTEMPVDGVCGPATWALLLLRAEDELRHDTVPSPPPPELSLPDIASALAIARDFELRSARLVELLGGKV